jgi:hypothetical protein
MEEAKAIIMSNGTKGGGGGDEARGGFVLKSRSDEAPVRRRSLVERTGMKNLMQVLVQGANTRGDTSAQGEILLHKGRYFCTRGDTSAFVS